MNLSDMSSILESIPENPGQSLLLGLAVIGGGVIGGLVTGLLGQGGVKLSTGQGTPRWALNAMRAFGGLASAVIMAVLLFSEAGGRGRGKGGSGDGDGSGNGIPVSLLNKDKEAKPENKDKKPEEPPKPARPLRVAVVRPPEEAAGKWYRIEGEEDNKRYTLPEIQKEIQERKKTEPAITAVVLVLTHPDSPGKRTGPVEDLVKWIEKDAKLDARQELPGASDSK